MTIELPASTTGPRGPKVRPGETVSDAALAVFARYQNRPTELVEIDGYFGVGGEPVPAVLVRVPTKWEQDNAVDLSVTYVNANITEPQARANPKVTIDAELCALAWWCCRDAKRPEYPAWPSPDWMAKAMTADQIGVLVNLVNGVRAKHSANPQGITPADLDTWVDICADAPEDAYIPFIASKSHEQVLVAFVLLATRCKQLEKDNQAMRDGIDLARSMQALDEPTGDGEVESEVGTEPIT